jgi:sensitive to high expression protein 9, mitochondrial
MQPAPFRLAQCIRIAFSASKARPQPRVLRVELHGFSENNRLCPSNRIHAGARFYSQRSQADRNLAQDEPSTKPFPSPELASEPKDSRFRPSWTSDASFSKRPNELPSHTESRRTDLSRRFSILMDNVQSNIFTASQRLNDLTGYSGIEALKKSIENQEELVSTTRQAVKAARKAYSSAVATRSDTQREVNDLLQRKHNWSPSDLERFTSLYRSDHTNEQAEQKAHDELGRCERTAEEASNSLAKSILARYHEEQIWSDKIRQMSTWGTWGLMGVNILLFLVFQVAVEPWRRKRLVKGFEEKVMEALEKEKVEVPPTSALAASAEDTVVTTDASAKPEPDVLAELVDEAKLEAAISMVDAVAPAASGNSSAIETAIEIIDAAEAIEAAKSDDDSPVALQESPAVQAVFGEPKTGYAYYEDAFRKLFSEKKVVMSQRDVTTAVLQGAAWGAAAMGLLLVLLRPR